MVGIGLGWQMLVALVMLATLAQFFTMLLARVWDRNSQAMWAASFLWATTMAICLWRHLPTLGLPSANSSPTAHWIVLIVSLIATYVTAKLSANMSQNTPLTNGGS